ncbi:aldehyde ferredoxin oxidoreductase family protein [[Clostridium] polysaccharolyticum]|uniref:Aldehyde:ferredoxin oxidoreductase n=1 Tax=[Clostridium] polysaccharolyticum TaxID=29364 RepID=A0A1I0EDP7_9FIRM|nr:aldehyde ferredoxin oxidoreductase family protein [[Clostridium] polysaccharolyticum]SET43278.1 aldehyde:ferredoxin oxidoreductase [[Clostridium] polysaccharolyticum]
MRKVRDDDIMWVDLTSGKIRREEVSCELREKFIGGEGINTKLLYDSGAMYHDPMSDENTFIVGIGPSVGTGLMAGNRCSITGKSPLTGIYGDSSTGGNFVLNMRALHIQHIVVMGKAQKPSYLFIDKDGVAKILDAGDSWGMKSVEVVDYFETIHGKRIEVLSIGPAGERQVRFASVIVSRWHAAGRMGMGCIMGNKNLKAIVIETKRPLGIAYHDEENLRKLNKKWFKLAGKSMLTKNESIDGSLFLMERYNKAKCLPIKNCQLGYEKRAEKVYSAPFNLKYVDKKIACYACTARCGRVFEIKDGVYKGEKGRRIDYGAAVSLGPALDIYEWDKIIHLKLIVDELGFDAMEVGGMLAMIMECSERGLIDDKFTNGRKFHYSNMEDIEYLLNCIVDVEDSFGRILAGGTERAAKILGIEKYSYCVKKSSTGTHSKDRLAWSLGYVTSTRGGDHLKNFPFTMLFGGYFADQVAKYIFNVNPKEEIAKPEKKGRVVWWHENYKYAMDSMGFCLFAMHSLPNLGAGYFDEYADILNYIYGTELKDTDIFFASERIYQLQNMINVISGQTIEDYKWPVRNPDENISKEYLEMTTIKSLNNPGMLPEYFKFRGLTADGKPTKQRFKELGLIEEMEALENMPEEGGNTMSQSLEHVAINAKFKFWDKEKAIFMSMLLVHLLGRMEKKRIKEYKLEQMRQEMMENENNLSKQGGRI